MDKFLNTYKEIQVASRSKSIKVLSMTLIVIALIISFSVASLKMFVLAQENTQILDSDGRVRSHTYINPDSASVIRCKAFVDEFSFYYFDFFPNSKEINEKLTFALELGDNSLKRGYEWFLSKNWYSDLIASNIRQSFKLKKLEVIPKENSFKVNAEGVITLTEVGSSTGNVLYYSLKFTLDAVPHKQSYPQFKQGLFIQNFRFNLKEL